MSNGSLSTPALTLGETASIARAALGERVLVAWWCEPTIDLALSIPPTVFGCEWPDDEGLQIDEVAFYAENACWRVAQTSSGPRWVLIKEVQEDDPKTVQTAIVHTPAHLHASSRFSAAKTEKTNVLLREWHVGEECLGFTLEKEMH